MPIFGYSESDLTKAYKRGVESGHSKCTHELFDALSEIFPDWVRVANRDLYHGIPGIVRGLKHIQKREESRRSSQQGKLDFLNYACPVLEADINALQPDKLYATINRLAAEYGRLKQDIAATQNEVEHSRATRQAKRRELLDEIERLDKMVVEHECKMHSAR